MAMSLYELKRTLRAESETGRKMYFILAEILNGRRSRAIATNTTLAREDNDDITVTLHWTKVLTFHPNNTVTLDMNGWNTVTTRARLNLFAPDGDITFSVYTKQYAPRLTTRRKAYKIYHGARVTDWGDVIFDGPFVDGMTIDLGSGQLVRAPVEV